MQLILKKIFACVFILSLFFSKNVDAALIIQPAEIVLRIEDLNFKQKVITSVSFADKEVALEKSGISDFRKELKFKLMPGIYPLKWSSRKGDISWIDKEEQHHEYLIEIEKKDRLVHIKIRGDDLTLY